MRTTLTIDPDVASLLEQEVQRSRKPLKQVVNEALRSGLTRAQAKPRELRLKVSDSRLRPGYDPASFNRLADEHAIYIEQLDPGPIHAAIQAVVQMEFLADRLGEDVDDLPIDVVEDVDHQQEPERVSWQTRAPG